jgi:hypothetical protein
VLLPACAFTPPAAQQPGDDDSTLPPPVDASMVVIDAPPPPPDAPEPDAPPGSATTDCADVADTFVASDARFSNFSDQTSALADGVPLRFALYRFDCSAIAPTATVQTAELHIFTDFDPGGTCQVFAALRAWDETQVTWQTQPTIATTACGTIMPATADTENVVTIDPTVVAGWIANPTSNFGFAIVSGSSDGARFTTREGSATRHAVLRVTHVP